MKLSTKCRYGMRAIVFIAARYGTEKPVQRKSIVSAEGIPDSYLENILIALKNRGIVSTVRGPKGGFMLRQDPSSLTMKDIMEALSGSLSPVECVDNPKACERVDTCVTRPVWIRLKESQDEILSSVTIQDLVDQSRKNHIPMYEI